jgi:hypothetical protein
LVGKKTRSAAALTTTGFLPRENFPRSPKNAYAEEAYAMRIGSARGNRLWRESAQNLRAKADIGGMFGAL